MIEIDFNPSAEWTDSERKHLIDLLASELLLRFNALAVQPDEIRDALERIIALTRKSPGFLEASRAAILRGQGKWATPKS